MKADGDELNRSRLDLLNAFILIAVLVIVGKLFQKQVLESNAYKVKAEKQHIVKQSVPAQRGQILVEESDGQYPLATNIIYYEVWVVPRSIKEPKKVALELAKALNLNQDDVYGEINNKKLYIPPLKKNISKTDADKIAKLGLPGVYLMPKESRLYPEATLAGQSLGYVDTEGKGKYGIEAFYDEILQGIKGVRVSSRDSYGRKIATIKEEQKESDGAGLVLTLNRSAQFKAEQLLVEALKTYEADKGSIVVMDVETGGIVAMAAVPSYDPNGYSEAFKSDPNIFRNPISSDVWEPGSIMKPIVMGMALDQGLVNPSTEEVFDSCVKVQNYPICTATKKAFGRETMTQVLENSDNVAMVWLSDMLGNESMYRYFKRIGFGEKSGVDLQGESMGTIKDFKRWTDLSRSTMSFGQGMTTTPLQMVAAYAAIANNGMLIKPHLVEEIRKSNGTSVRVGKEDVRRVFSKKTAQDLTQMLISVIEKGHGKRAEVKGYWIGGKTGTAQIANPEGGYYEDRHVGSFAGFFPADKPKFAMVVKVDNPKATQWAESSAAPIFGQMAQWLLNYYRISPNRTES